MYLIMLTIPINTKISIPKFSNRISTFFSKNQEEIVQQEFNNIDTLELFCDYGNITIHSWQQKGCLVEIKKEGNCQQVSTTDVSIEHQNNFLQIQTNCPQKKQQCPTHFNVIVPEQTSIKVATKSGNIFIKNASGETYAHSQSGNIKIIDGANDLLAKSVSGNITVQREHIETQHTATIETSSGTITLQVPQYIGCNLNACSKYGKILSNLFITLAPQTIKLNEETYKQQRHCIKGSILKQAADFPQGLINLTTTSGMIKICSYV